MRISDWSSDVCSSDLAGRAILSHGTVMVKGTSQVFAAGPPGVERSVGQKITKEDLGGAGMAVDAAGTIDNVAADVAQCFQKVRRYLSFMPSNVWELPPVTDCDDPVDRCDEALASIIRSEEHTSELQSLMRISYAVFCLKKKI